MSRRQPPPPSTIPEEMPPPRSRYHRPRRLISIWGLLLGLLLGVAGGLTYAWVYNPVVEFDTEPWQLQSDERAEYMVAIALAFANDSDLDRAVTRLLTLYPNRVPQSDPFQDMADTACELASTGYVDGSSGLRAIRQMMAFYRLQGRSGCADTLITASDVQPTQVIEIDLPTPTLPPPATKTPTPVSTTVATTTPTPLALPTSPPQRDFVIANVSTFCDVELSGIIEVFVQDFGGEGLPGQAVRARWRGGEDTFFTGLKPERGPAYADFQMTEAIEYTVDMPGRSDDSQPLPAAPCTTQAGARAITSYRVVFLPAS